jgi:hypothetical protein
MRRSAIYPRIPARAPSHRAARPAPVSARWLVLALAALLSFAGQNLVTQTHVHFDIEPVASTRAAPPLARHRAPASPASCPICHEAAQTAFYLIADPVALVLPVALAFWMAVPLGAAWSGRRRSHAWHSRGPPAPRLA